MIFFFFLSVVPFVFALEQAPIFSVNLDEKPINRWPAKQLCTQFKQPMLGAVKMLNDFVQNQELREALIIAAEVMVKSGRLGVYGEEIIGLFNEPACHELMPLGTGVLMNLIYEVQAGCTSIIAKTSNGTMLHARNLDFDQATALSELVIQVEFQQNNVTVFTSATFAGYVGVLTGQRHGAFSVTMDERDLGESDPLLDNVVSFLLGGKAIPFVTRAALDTVSSYDQALSIFQKTPLIAPCYIIVCGVNPGDGAVVTRFRENTAFVTTTFPFLLETNYDLNKPAGDPRRAAARQALAKIPVDDVNEAALLKVLSTPPVLNDGTTMSAFMSPKTGYFSSYPRKH